MDSYVDTAWLSFDFENFPGTYDFDTYVTLKPTQTSSKVHFFYLHLKRQIGQDANDVVNGLSWPSCNPIWKNHNTLLIEPCYPGAYVGILIHGFKFPLTLITEPVKPILYTISSKIHGFHCMLFEKSMGSRNPLNQF